MQHIVEKPSANAEQALAELDNLLRLFTEPIKKYEEHELEIETKTREARTRGAQAKLGANGKPAIGIDASKEISSDEKKHISVHVDEQEKIVFPELNRQLSKVLELANARLCILFDEWSSIPADLQPYLAEFLKKNVITNQRIVLKIASLEHRSRFYLNDENLGLIGFELGADISTTTDLDDYYVYDRNPEILVDTYADMLYRHLSSELPDDYLVDKYGVKNGRQLASKMFTERNTFKELARASEGVIRDLINIFNLAFFSARRRGGNNIDKKAIIESARQWFEQDKQPHLEPSLQAVLRRIVDEVIGKRRARSFLLPRELERHPVVQKLFDLRVLHQMLRGYADKDNPGVRYNIYSLDYGTYVDLLGTTKAPALELEDVENGEEVVVPFDDKRSIRRIILNEDILT